MSQTAPMFSLLYLVQASTTSEMTGTRLGSPSFKSESRATRIQRPSVCVLSSAGASTSRTVGAATPAPKIADPPTTIVLRAPRLSASPCAIGTVGILAQCLVAQAVVVVARQPRH